MSSISESLFTFLKLLQKHIDLSSNSTVQQKLLTKESSNISNALYTYILLIFDTLQTTNQ